MAKLSAQTALIFTTENGRCSAQKATCWLNIVGRIFLKTFLAPDFLCQRQADFIAHSRRIVRPHQMPEQLPHIAA